MPEIPAPTPTPLFYGWYVVGAVGLTLMTASGLAFYNLSVLLDAFVRERGFSVSIASGATASFFLASGIAGVISGRLLERLDARILMIASACVSSIALACLGLVQNSFQLYAFHVALGFCNGFGGLIPGTTVVARWFEARRPLALSIASTGLSLGGIVLTPASAFLIGHSGLAGAAPWLGLMFFMGVVPVTALVVRASPYAMGLEPDGPNRRRPAAGSKVWRGVRFAQARRSRFFIGLTAAWVFGLGAQVAAIAHLYRLASAGGNADVAALAVSLLAAASVVGRLGGGWILPKVSTRAFALGMLALQAIALVVLALPVSAGLLLAAAALFGITVGNVLMLQPLLLAEAFGTREFSRIYSASSFVTTPGVAGGPVLLGVIYEASGGYAAPYLFTAGATLLSFWLLWWAGATRPEENATPEAGT